MITAIIACIAAALVVGLIIARFVGGPGPRDDR